jgi:uncharacterized Zn-finger protein
MINKLILVNSEKPVNFDHPPVNGKKRLYFISSADLPLCCPLPNQQLWDAHPRIYLPLLPSLGTAKCPYCGTQYQLREPKS